ncbi:MAG: heme utilization cystosolic carrier protein HutX [Oxalobacter sp.]|nr:heme utilization cystosolic carrier protein HutX [Oxalobacter sp.]
MDKAAVGQILKKNPGVILEGLAKSSGFSMAELIELLPQEMWQKTEGEHFVEIMQAIAMMGKITFVMHTADVVLEFSGILPTGEMGHGFYNLSYQSPLHGHLRASNCQSIYLVERPFMNKQTISVQFMNEAGDAMFKIFAGRDDNGEHMPEQLDALRSLFDRALAGATA